MTIVSPQWKTSKLSELPLQFVDGDRSARYPKRSEFVTEGVPFLNAESISSGRLDVSKANYISTEKFGSILKGRLQPGDLILTTRRNGVGKSAYFEGPPRPALINAQLLILRPDQRIIFPKYFYYSFCDFEFQSQIRNFVSGSAQPQLPIHSLRNIVCRLPPFPTQRKIASILSAYDDLIENNTRRIAILEEMAQAIYREWFVNFRFPGHENVKLVESSLGMIPEEWELKCLSELGFIGREKSRHRPRNAPELYGGPYPLFQTGDITAANTFLWKHSQTYSEAGLAQSKLWKPGTLCITIAANIADTAILSKTACFPDSVVGFVSHPGEQCVYFVKLFLETIKGQMKNVSRGTTQDNLSLEKLLSFKVPTPTSNVLHAFHSCVTPVFNNVLCLSKKNDNLRTTRDLLLPKLISGQLDVEDLDIETSEPLVEAEA